MHWSLMMADTHFWADMLAQATNLTVQDLAQQIDALQNQLEALQTTNQALRDGLAEQVKFLQQENQDLTNSFTRYVDAMKWNLTVLAGLAAVLDLQNWVLPSGQRFGELPEADREAQAKEQIDGLLEALPLSAVLVVYIRGTIKYLYGIRDGLKTGLEGHRYVLPANNPVTLVGNTADGAYVALGEQSGSK